MFRSLLLLIGLMFELRHTGMGFLISHVRIGTEVTMTYQTLHYFSFQPLLHDWCNKGSSMLSPVCVMVHIKEPLLLTRKRIPCSGIPPETPRLIALSVLPFWCTYSLVWLYPCQAPPGFVPTGVYNKPESIL